jgi:chromosome partitioning protein
MATVITIANRKGRVGKSTTTFNLAAALARRGKHVLAIDNDPQGSLTILFGHDHNQLDEEEKTLYFSLVGERPLAELAIRNNPKLIPASKTLTAAESKFATNILLNGVNAMKERVQEVRDQYDFISSDYVLIPVETNNLSKYNPRYTHDNEVLSVIRDRLAAQHIRLFDPINRSTAFDKSSTEGKAAVNISPDIQGAQAYEKLADEIAGL